MDPAGNEVQLVLATDDDAIGKTRAASYEFAYNNGDVLEAAVGDDPKHWTVSVPSGRTIIAPVDALDETDDPEGTQVLTSLAPGTAEDRTQTIEVEHDLTDVASRVTGDNGTDRTLTITLTLENAPPALTMQIADQVLDRGTDGDTYGTPANNGFTDDNADDLAFTAFISNPEVATLEFADNANGVVGAWWNTLGGVPATTTEPDQLATRCNAQNAALGLSGSNRDRTPEDSTGACQAFADLDAADMGTVTALFHWDLLTGAEMEYAAMAGGESNPSAYKKAFKDLDSDEREVVAKLVADGVIAQGSGALTATRVNTGSAEITIKASDATGRFLSKSSPAQRFSVSTPLMIIGPVNDDVEADAPGRIDDDLMTDGIQVKTNLSGVAAGQTGADVVIITTDVVEPDDGPAFLLTGTDAGSFYAARSGASGEITTAGVLAAGTYEFTVTAAVHGVDAAADVIVSVGHTNRAPEVVSGSATSFVVLEQGQDGAVAEATVIHDFMANFTDPDREVDLTFKIDPVDDEDDGAVEFHGKIHFPDDGSVLKTKDVSFAWDDPDENRRADNTHSYKVTVSDASGLSASQTITIEITNYIPPPPTPEPSTDIMVDENITSDDEDAAATVDVRDVDGDRIEVGYKIRAQSPLGLVEDGPDPGDDPDAGKVWTLDDEGGLRLAEGALPPDFENPDYPNRFIIAVEAGVTGAEEFDAFTIIVNDVNEAPKFEVNKDNGAGNAKGIAINIAPVTATEPEWALYVLETSTAGSPVGEVRDSDGNLSDDTTPGQLSAVDEDGDPITYSLMDWLDTGGPNDAGDGVVEDNELTAHTGPFAIDSGGNVTVSGTLDADSPGSTTVYPLLAVATDDDATDPLSGNFPFTIYVVDSNEPPEFDERSRTDGIAVTIDENSSGDYTDCESIADDGSTAVGTCIFDYHADDADDDHLTYKITDSVDAEYFAIDAVTGAVTVAARKVLNYEVQAVYEVNIEVEDSDRDTGATDTLDLTVTLINLNDNDPTISGDSRTIVKENTPRGTLLATYKSTDADGDIDGDGTVVSYSLSGTHSKSFSIVEIGQDPNDGTWRGELRTLESLDYDDGGTPCPAATGCDVTVVASDGERKASVAVAIIVANDEDSVSTLNVTKANPVPGTTMGDAMTALGNTKTSISVDVPERPADLPNATGAPLNFVETDWANWGTVLRIEVTAQSPDGNCGSGNECVVIILNSDSADDTLKLEAYRMDTPAGAASNEDKFVAAVMLVELDGEATNVKDSGKNDIPVYAHTDGSVPRLQVDEEDEIEIEFGNLRGDVEVENEAPEISNFAPEHEAAFDDADVDYTFTVTDTHSGLPEPEDLPDADGDDAYMPAVALISKGQCETADSDNSAESKKRRAELNDRKFELVGDMANISDDESLYCPGVEQDGEYDAGGAGYGFAPIRDDKDFDEIDDGFDVETTIVLRENKIFYVTFVACDNAGNCSFFDPDGNDDAEELAQITVDTEDPVFVEARTGLTWDSTDNEYDDNRSFIQVIFNDLTKLNTETVEIDDFVVEGHTIKDVQVFENPDDDDVTWGDSGDYGAAGSSNKRGIARYRDIENSVFVELEDELLADETPDVTIVPNGVEDKAGNEQDDGDHEADDWISPKFTIVSIVSTRETSQDQILAGDDDEVTVVVTSDERLDSTRPTVTVTYVIAPAGSINTKGTEDCDDGTTDGGTRERGEIMNSDECADSSAATGGNLNNSVEKVSNTEWIVTITEPKDTGYYNFRISGNDRSPQENPGSEGVSPGAIVTDFFDADGDVNVDDAIFFEGDINLPKPQVRVSGVSVEDNEADVEFRSPLFVELDFAANHSDNCRNVDTDERLSNCMNENSEYAEDNFDDIVVTSFVLDGVDLTDSVKTTDNQSFLVSLESISIGDHTAEVQAVDQAGNVFEDTLEIDFEVNDRDPFEKRLSPGWNLVSLPGEPADSSIASVFGPGVEVRTVYSYDPVIPGGWMVAVRETLDSDWQGDLTEITGQHGYWVLSDAIQDWEVSIPRLAGGASGTGTPIQPPVIPMYAGWNLIPVTDVSGNALSAGIEIDAAVYLRSLDDGLDLARVLGYDTIRNEWFTVLDMQMGSPGDLSIGSGYWVFVREAVALVPGGVAGVGGGD